MARRLTIQATTVQILSKLEQYMHTTTYGRFRQQGQGQMGSEARIIFQSLILANSGNRLNALSLGRWDARMPITQIEPGWNRPLPLIWVWLGHGQSVTRRCAVVNEKRSQLVFRRIANPTTAISMAIAKQAIEAAK